MKQCSLAIISLISSFFPVLALAQIVPDSTLNSEVKQNGAIVEITEGSTAGNNLFHSFKEFSIKNGAASFLNKPNIQNIFSRVTGTSISEINGIIQANGSANLFLLNPNGILFGPNAQLDIGGSFFATTANTIFFDDGTNFSASNPSSLVTINVPVGLGFANNPGSIYVANQGHNLLEPLFSPVIRDFSDPGLQVKTGKTLTLIGGDIIVNGGILTAESGRIEIGSVTEGKITFTESSSGWIMDYEEASSFGNINFSQRALIDASGSPSGSIQVQGKNLLLTDSSTILLQNQGIEPSGDLLINSESLEIRRENPAISFIFSGSIRSESVNSGKGGNITIYSKNLNHLKKSGGTR